ncbi:maltose acetyltransferase domain-containing protein, partial [Segatella buccae]|uniref:maltose acetyltransferase domain-containing protein n=2 Tax=Bacteroidales TaxID=171549 RepID=UPI003FD7E82D
MSVNNLLPETDYRAWDKKLVALREETHKALLLFNTTGDKQVLKELFHQPLEDIIIVPPLHCNYGGN